MNKTCISQSGNGDKIEKEQVTKSSKFVMNAPLLLIQKRKMRFGVRVGKIRDVFSEDEVFE